jgi:hypothetical protein
LILVPWGGPAHGRLPAVAALRASLERDLPVDDFDWPFWQARPMSRPLGEATDALASAIKPEHHVIDVGGGASERASPARPHTV